MQVNPIKARKTKLGTEITEKMGTADDSISKTNCGLLRPHSLGNEYEGMHVEPLNQEQDMNATNKQADPEIEDADLVKQDSRAFSEDVTRSPTSAHVSCTLEDPKVSSNLENFGLQCENMVHKSTLSQLESQPVYKVENHAVGQLEPTVKDTIENGSFTVGQGSGRPSLPMDKSNHLGLCASENASSKVVACQETPASLDCNEGLVLALESQRNDLGSAYNKKTKNPSNGSFEPTELVAIDGMNLSGDRGTPLQSRKRKSMTRPPVTANRVLRSRSKEEPETPQANSVMAEVNDDGKKRRKMRRKQQINKHPVSETSRIKSHLRYLLQRIKYEQNLIDAYSGEGWKGQSLDKIKPEKELQRARSHILRYKLKIRDLFQRLDLSLDEGKLPESLFDAEGEIDSEDIFCAKCGSKDLADNNDIILCDGACERGFHQFCLEPPLLKEDIPPGDEGWLCPGCECKVNCLDLLSDFHGTNLSVVDNWEKVFPEAAAASGKKLVDGSGFPSDDSEDDDYDPDKPELDDKLSGDESSSDGESSSDESDYFSASDVPPTSLVNEQYLALPSEDSEDDDFNPDAPDRDEQLKQDSSSSDFSSESEDLEALLNDNTSPGEDQGQTSHDTGKVEVGKVRRNSLRDELSSLLGSDMAPVSGKRHVERMDYKKLYDETYGNVSSDSSDDDYAETGGRGKRSNSGKISGENPTVNKENIECKDCNQKSSEHTPKRVRKKLSVEDRNNLSMSHKSSPEAGSRSKSTSRQYKKPYKKLGEVVTQRLLESFKENQYPERPVKENLAKELELTIQQVSKWFENARWSARHSATVGSNITAAALSGHTSSLQSDKESSDMKRKTVEKGCTNGSEADPVVRACQPADGLIDPVEVNGQTSGTPRARKRKGKMGKPNHENSKTSTTEDQRVRRSSRLQSGDSKSVS